MERLREHESHEADPYTYNCYDQYTPLQQNCTYSVLSPDNRQFLERPRSKSPDMRNKRMIIGQKSFAFGHDGDLIEIDPADKEASSKSSLSNDQSSMHNSNISRRLNTSSTVEKKLLKQLSFDDDTEIYDNGRLETQVRKADTEIKVTSTDNGIDHNENIASNITSIEEDESDVTLQATGDTRRASDGSCEIKYQETVSVPGGRRHSDSVVHTIENCTKKSTLQHKRRTLKRQSRVTDTEAVDYCDFTLLATDEPENNSGSNLSDETHTCKDYSVYQSQQSTQSVVSKSTEIISENEYCGARLAETFFKGTHACVQTANKSSSETGWLQQREKCSNEEEQEHCYENKAGQACKHGENGLDCCCYSNAKKYWKKMDKIIQENKKLETIVAKNRREMAEIREMLSSVLSVRMEPGF